MRPPVRDLAGKNVFVTGAASGIGRAVALQAAREGAVLHLTDIQAEQLAAVAEEATAAGGRVALAEPADITDRDAVRRLAKLASDASGAMDVVLNVAGIAIWGTVRGLEHEHWRSLVEVNLMGPIHVIETFVPPMVAAGTGGHLVNVSSAAGIVALPWHAAYSASKFGLRGLSEVLRFDLARHRIGVSVVVPGAVKTPLVQTVQIAGVDREDPRVQKWTDRFSGHAVSPEHVAECILKGVRRNRFLIYTSADIRALYLFKRVAWWPYSVAMRSVNVLFTKALRPARRG